jgi:ATP phosphoribosyltransferase
MVGIMLNVNKADLPAVLAILPALHRPTVAPLSEDGWFALITVIDEAVVRDLIPDILNAGGEGIVEFSLNKLVK